MKQKHPVIEGTLILALAGFLSRIIGFYNRIFLSRTIGAKELGIYQMIFPVYLFCFAICCQGFQVGLSKLIAENKAAKKDENVSFLLKTAILFCCFVSLLLSFFLFFLSDEISIAILNTSATSLCLKITAFALPFVTVKGCIQGYYIGCGISSVPALCQLVEQITRVISILVIAHSFLYIKCSGAKLAVTGMVFGEIVSCLLMIFLYRKDTEKKKSVKEKHQNLFRDFLLISFPLSASRICLTLLQSIEAILIPKQLILFYCDSSLSLELYGILTGITLPFLLFPSTVTNSLATMILPSVSTDCKKQNYDHLNRTITLTTYGCFLMGLLFTGIYFLLGPMLGSAVFHNPAAGEYLKVLSFLCPAMYLSSVFTSILNGMGKTKETFFHNILSIIIRLLFIFFAIPDFGIDGYIWGLLLSTFASVLFNYIEIQHTL